mmetsp:Transcript_87749/g.223341  ORF Transcript_87749/g.223341 Transcript_87749/m.223341 type:complete len:210 (-) Transcript_87749:51-680(-)
MKRLALGLSAVVLLSSCEEGVAAVPGGPLGKFLGLVGEERRVRPAAAPPPAAAKATGPRPSDENVYLQDLRDGPQNASSAAAPPQPAAAAAAATEALAAPAPHGAELDAEPMKLPSLEWGEQSASKEGAPPKAVPALPEERPKAAKNPYLKFLSAAKPKLSKRVLDEEAALSASGGANAAEEEAHSDGLPSWSDFADGSFALDRVPRRL